MSKSYSEKLKSPKWQKKRLEVLEKADWKCECCGDKEETLHVHHTFYEKGREVWEYDKDDLSCLCSNCHEKTHQFYSRIKEKTKYGMCKNGFPDTIEASNFVESFFELSDFEEYVQITILLDELIFCCRNANEGFSKFSEITMLLFQLFGKRFKNEK